MNTFNEDFKNNKKSERDEGSFATGKFHTPFPATIAVMIMGMVLSGFFPIGILGPLTSMGALLSFGMVCFGVLLLRYKQPHLDRPFKPPWFPAIPFLGTLFCLTLMALLPSVIWMQFSLLLVFWCAIYFLYSRKNSKVRQG